MSSQPGQLNQPGQPAQPGQPVQPPAAPVHGASIDRPRSTAKWKLLAVVAVCLVAAWSLGSASRQVLDANEVAIVTGPPAAPLPTLPEPPPANEDCRGFDPRASYPSSQTPSPSPAIDRIRQRGKLIAGVSADTLLFGSRNPFTGTLDGLDVDLVRQLATAIFGSNPNDQRVQFRVITYADRLPLLESGAIDVVAHTMTINCARWNRIAFSTEYYTAGQQLLVKRDTKALEIEDLPAGTRVCVPAGGTSVDNLKQIAPAALAVQVPDITQCLVLMQQGKADAALSDDTVVKGMALQDPYVKVIGRLLSEEPYGMGFNAKDTDLVQVANAMLDTIRSDGTFDKLRTQNSLPLVAPPMPNNSRPLPST